MIGVIKMREILFRGKDKTIGEWVTGNLYQNQDQCFIMANNRNNEVIPETVGQFTGLTDKNGKKIFEGDISKGKTVNGKQINYVFWFDETERAFMYGSSYKGGYRLSLSAYQLSTNEFEVIGNIYDNPELIEQED